MPCVLVVGLLSCLDPSDLLVAIVWLWNLEVGAQGGKKSEMGAPSPTRNN